MNPNLTDAYNGRGVARNDEGGRLRFLSDDPARRRQEAEGLWQDAVADFNEAIRRNGREPGYWVNLMISYRLLDDMNAAAAARATCHRDRRRAPADSGRTRGGIAVNMAVPGADVLVPAFGGP